MRSNAQSVYDPSYVPRPWLKWVIFGATALIGLFIWAGVAGSQDNTTPVAHVAAPATPSDTAHSATGPSDKTLYKVMKVVDGDTIDVLINGKTERIRLIGMDTPETVDPRKVVQCFGREASDKAKSLLQDTEVHLEQDATQGERDKYNRLLAYIYLQDGTNYNQHMIAEGYAHEYTYRIPYKYQSEFKKAQTTAREGEKGLWSPATCGGDTSSAAKAPAPVTPPPAPKQAAPKPAASNNCDPNYSPCIPNVSYDLDCGDISGSVRVIGTDRHRFDRDGDGYGCEAN